MDNDRPVKAAKINSASPRSVIKDAPLVEEWPGRDLRAWTQTLLRPKRDADAVLSEQKDASFPGRPVKTLTQSSLPFVPGNVVR